MGGQPIYGLYVFIGGYLYWWYLQGGSEDQFGTAVDRKLYVTPSVMYIYMEEWIDLYATWYTYMYIKCLMDKETLQITRAWKCNQNCAGWWPILSCIYLHIHIHNYWHLMGWDFRIFMASIFPAAKHTKVESPGFQILVAGYCVEFVDGRSINIWNVCIHWRLFILALVTGKTLGSVWSRNLYATLYIM